MIIRAATLGDAAAIAHVSVDTWRATYRGLVPDGLLDGLSYAQTEADWAMRIRFVRGSSTCVFVAEDNGAVVGFASGGPADALQDDYMGQLFTLYVRAASQGGGIGRALVAAVAQYFAEIDVTAMQVWALAVGPANAFYQRLGGTPLGTLSFDLYGYTLDECGYGWADTSVLLAQRTKAQSKGP